MSNEKIRSGELRVNRLRNLFQHGLLTDEEKFPLFLLTLCFGVYFFLLNLWPYVGLTMGRNKQWLIFVASWISVPALATLCMLALRFGKQKFFPNKRHFYVIFLIWNSASLMVGIGGLHSRLLSLNFVVLLIPLANLMAFLSLWFLQSLSARMDDIRSLELGVYTALPLLAILALINFIPLPSRYCFLAATVLASVSLFHEKIAGQSFSKMSNRILDGVVLFFLVGVVFDATLHFDRHHHNFYLGPINDLMAGRSMLVDVTAQYGVFIYYFLALFFQAGLLPFSYQGLAFLANLLLLIQYGAIYLLLRYVLKSQIFSVLALSLAVMMIFIGPNDFMRIFPSTGFLRFGPVYLLLLFVAGRSLYPAKAWFFQTIEALVVGFSSIWSLETFFYVGSTYLGVLFIENYRKGMNSGQWFKITGLRLAPMFLSMGLAFLVLEMAIRWHAGEWPYWPYYWEYVFAYTVTRQSANMPMTPWHPWVLVVAIYFSSLIALGYRLFLRPKNADSPEFKMAFALTISGIAQFTYFIMYAHMDKLLASGIPAIFLSFYWLLQASKAGLPRLFKMSFFYSCYAGITMLFLLGFPGVKAKADRIWIVSLTEAIGQFIQGQQVTFLNPLASLGSKSPTDDRVVEALALIEKYANDKTRVGLFITHDLNTETLMLARKTHVFPISNPMQDAIPNSARMRILGYRHGLKEGDMIFLEKKYLYETKELEYAKPAQRLQGDMVERLRRTFSFEEIETSPHGITAVRLGLGAGRI